MRILTYLYREKQHLDALGHLSHNDWIKACQEWEDILVDYPKGKRKIPYIRL